MNRVLKNIKVATAIMTASSLLNSCGSANINKLFGSKDDSYASLLQRAQLAYDVGDFSTAEELANKAYDRSENNGDAGVLLGSVYLSQAGIDIFQMVSKLSTLSSTKTSTSSSTTTTDKCSSESTTNKNASNLLSELSCKILSLSDADKEVLGSDKSFPGLTSIGVTSVYIPSEITDELRAKVSVLSALDKGIRRLCPFINRSLVLSQSLDERHTDEAICPDRTSTSFNNTKAHIAFALLHLVEALVYQQGLLVDGLTSATSTTTSSSKTGIQGVSTKINSATFTSATQFATTLTEFKNVIDSVFDTTNPKAQIALTLNGFIMVSQSFEAAGMPSSVTSAITKQLAKLKETAATLKGSSTGSDSSFQTQALKGQINESYAKTMATKINSQCPSASSCTEQKAELCASYSGISNGVDPTKVTTPTICQ